MIVTTTRNKWLLLMIFIIGCGLLSAGESKNPTRAALYSAFLPGGGQVYNGAYAKAGIVIGVQGYLLGKALYHDSKVDDYARKAAQTDNIQLAQTYKARRDEFREKRTSDIWWMGISLGLSVLDAWVDAHLYNFDADKDQIHLLFEDDKLKLQLDF